ncbi:MAG: CPBP family intramembrane metalloprotease [Leptolyngbyaceae cyanobacterium MO_188.B28]|nr:CPBP family intramembrane metalloprotease [Leptolyngbyaceae cyanobacterium MO_188.B28]
MGAFVEAPAIAKIFVFFFGWLLLWAPIAIPLAIALKWRPPQPITPGQKLPLLASLYLIVPFLLREVAKLEGFPFSDYGLAWNPSLGISLALGVGLALLGLGLLFTIQTGLGWIVWRSPSGDQISSDSSPAPEADPAPSLLQVALPLLFLALCISWTEELVFRGFLVNQLQLDYIPWIAAAISSLIFAVLHLVWEGQENIPSLPGLCLMGMVLVLARWADDGSLGLAWGLHTGWVWGMASLDTAQVTSQTGKGPLWILGKPGQPLAGLMTMLLLLGTAAVVWLVKG